MLTMLYSVDLIFKNQAMSTRDKPQGQFVNDLLRTEFHKYVQFFLIFLHFLICMSFQKVHVKIHQGEQLLCALSLCSKVVSQ